MDPSRLHEILEMHLFDVDGAGLLYVAPEIIDWRPLAERKIRLVIDLEEEIDQDVPAIPDNLIYVYFPFADSRLPDLVKLHAVGRLVADMVRHHRAVLVHCSMGLNRSPLVAGLALTHLGMRGADALRLLQERRPGVLYNKVFADYLADLAPHPEPPTPVSEQAKAT